MVFEYSDERKEKDLVQDELEYFTVNNGKAIRSNSSTNTLYCPIRGNNDDGNVVYSLE